MIDVVLLSHYDLDGAGVSVLSDHIWNVVARKHQGYPKIRRSLCDLIATYADSVSTIVIADLKVEPKDLKLALAAFDNVIYYDHHESSEEYVAWQEKYRNLTVHFSLDFCSTALVYMDGVKTFGLERTKELDAVMNTVNVYDLWKTDAKRWDYSVKLNDMFWHLHMDDFRSRFKDGFNGYTANELQFLADLDEKRIEVINTAVVEEMESGSQIVVVKESKAINFVTQYKEGDLFYIISPDYSMHNVSVRTKEGFVINVNDAIGPLAEKYPDLIISAGGHAAAGGITFKNHLTLNEIVDFLYENDHLVRSDLND